MPIILSRFFLSIIFFFISTDFIDDWIESSVVFLFELMQNIARASDQIKRGDTMWMAYFKYYI